ncbi:right-handed parallel beta-helix repeat-containing protein [Amycolatopsis rubida]|uniref:right-handed parallel beta-helix repeat-containing protein n=1 Tax=Amycolatopsis rubida TaxID=112413 RepID=UPI00142F3C52|nr:right-handed parallel beta-helix repeat-containing protein [Amycolatopsis rubida]
MPNSFVRRAAAALALSLVFAWWGVPALAKTGRTFYVDCAAGNDAAAGTSAAASWRTLAKLNATPFHAGDVISLRRGTTCGGAFTPSGAGTANSPIVLRAFGKGSRPKIAGTGQRAAVLLRNVEGWELRDLEVTNPGGSASTPRSGILVQLGDFGIGSHFVVDNVYVHDVHGCDCTSTTDPSGGIVFHAVGKQVPTGFHDVRITGSTVSGVDGMGIGTSSWWDRRQPSSEPGQPFVPITGFVARENRLADLGGDGIVVQNGVQALVERNVVDGYSLRATANHAGVWGWNTDRSVFQFNEVAHGDGAKPGVAYDVDSGNTDMVYQYNFSHDNGRAGVGGHLLLCGDLDRPSSGAIIRYNISQNDKTGITIACEGQPNTKIYNNVIHTDSAVPLVANYSSLGASLVNNVFSSQVLGSTITDRLGTYGHDLYYNVKATTPADTAAVVGDPLFLDPGRTGPAGFVLRCGSPAIGKGASVPDNGGRDLYGNVVPEGNATNIGAYAGAGVRP